jgi:hypothetical protein
MLSLRILKTSLHLISNVIWQVINFYKCIIYYEKPGELAVLNIKLIEVHSRRNLAEIADNLVKKTVNLYSKPLKVISVHHTKCWHPSHIQWKYISFSVITTWWLICLKYEQLSVAYLRSTQPLQCEEDLCSGDPDHCLVPESRQGTVSFLQTIKKISDSAMLEHVPNSTWKYLRYIFWRVLPDFPVHPNSCICLYISKYLSSFRLFCRNSVILFFSFVAVWLRTAVTFNLIYVMFLCAHRLDSLTTLCIPCGKLGQIWYTQMLKISWIHWKRTETGTRAWYLRVRHQQNW